MGIHKLLVVDKNDHLRGLYTLSDIERIIDESNHHHKPARDDSFRLLCGAAVSIPRDKDGKIDEDTLVEHVGAMIDQGLNLVAVSTAHGHTDGVGKSTRLLRETFKEITIMAGNVTSGEGYDFLSEAGSKCY